LGLFEDFLLDLYRFGYFLCFKICFSFNLAYDMFEGLIWIEFDRIIKWKNVIS